MGAEVHTVDIDEVFCNSIRKQAEFFGVNLTPHQEVFGYNPGGVFDIIIFYESFHHCRNFNVVVQVLRGIIKPGGKIMLAGEPIWPGTPLWAQGAQYPWGIRLEAEVASIVRFRKWFELGFQKDFLINLFARHGFIYRFHPGVISTYADIHEFSKTR
jgi:SAM-dependent methyltransferase